MGKLFIPSESGVEAFLRSATEHGYSMQDHLVPAATGQSISSELDDAGLLEDYTELVPTDVFKEKGMRIAGLLHGRLNKILSRIEGRKKNHLPRFSVRVFEAGEHGTTIHRNHSSVGPWAIGITLEGEAPFNVYEQNQLPKYGIIPLCGDSRDPEPLDSMNAGPGSAWTLYTANEQMPHSSGLVSSDQPRELIIFYGTDYERYL